jgi:hypothetical protein
MDAIARGWRAVLREHLPGDERPIAVALPSTPEGVALLVALTSLPPPVILLHPDVRAWRSEPPIPAGTPLVLPPALARLARDGDKLGLAPTALPSPSRPTCQGRRSTRSAAVASCSSRRGPRALRSPCSF